MAYKDLMISGHNSGVSVFIADAWITRLIGLLNRSSLSDREGLALMPCASIHTIGMRFSIDAVFLSRTGKVLGIKEDLRPFKFCVAPKGTECVLELASGNAKRTGINLELVLKFD